MEAVPSRPVKEALAEIAGVSLVCVFVAFAGLGLVVSVARGFPEEDLLTQVTKAAPVAGGEVLDHIGWGFGVDITVMLSFYAIVIGGQLIGSPAAAKNRRQLGFAAEVMAGMLVPALLLIIAACVEHPSKAGSLFVILPATAVTFFLAFQLSGFVVFEPAIRLANANRSLSWVKAQLSSLPTWSSRPLWLVLTVNTVVGSSLGMAASVGSHVAWEALVRGWLTCVGFMAVLTITNTYAVFALYGESRRFAQVLVRTLPVCMGLTVLAMVGSLMLGGRLWNGLSLLVVATFSFLTAMRQPRILGRLGSDWSVHGVGVALAARAMWRTYRNSAREIRLLTVVAVPEASLAGDRLDVIETSPDSNRVQVTGASLALLLNVLRRQTSRLRERRDAAKDEGAVRSPEV